ncbi:MAG: hypothetical protein WAU36_05945 [Cyclobacteriaceae bacterium]
MIGEIHLNGVFISFDSFNYRKESNHLDVGKKIVLREKYRCEFIDVQDGTGGKCGFVFRNGANVNSVRMICRIRIIQ